MNQLPVASRARRALVGAAAALTLTLAPVPALALTAAPADEAQSLPAAIDESIPDDAALISPERALLPSGEVVNVGDGSAVDDADLLGTPDAPPDPLDVTGGERFAPMSVGEARAALAQDGVDLLAVPGNKYGAYWDTYQGEPAFFMSDGTMFACQAIAVVDVSEHNGEIDWAAAKADGVQAAIIRIGFGTDRTDYCARRNIEECKRLGIPFGIYLYSYADSADLAREEGQAVVSWLRELGVSPSDLSLPVYYDLEQWVWTGHQPPTDPATYEDIVRAWFQEVQGAGYTNASIYSYRSYLYGPLNSGYIHERVSWAADYGPLLRFTEFSDNFRGWQYSSEGSVAGFAGNVDLNAFGYATWTGQVGTPEAGCPSASFSDFDFTAWYHDGVDWAVSAGLMSGYADGSGRFGASDPLYRGQLAQMLWNRAGRPDTDVTADQLFSDCIPGAYYDKAVAWCFERGYMTGYEDGEKFGPDDVMTREQLAVALWRMEGEKDVTQDLSSYPDANMVSGFALEAMEWAVSEGAITGQGATGALDPIGTLERGQAATILMRLCAE